MDEVDSLEERANLRKWLLYLESGLPTRPSIYGPYAKTICQTARDVVTGQAVTHGPATPAATTDADITGQIAGRNTSLYNYFPKVRFGRKQNSNLKVVTLT